MLKLDLQKFRLVFFLLSVAILFPSCTKKDAIESIAEEELFSLEYGNFEEQLNVFSLNEIGDVQTGICMKDGFFYIVNGESAKIMELNSYGDLLTLFYNEDSLTKELIDNSASSTISIHNEINFPFDYSGLIAVDSNKCVYVACTIPRDRQERSDDDNELYSQTVLRFPRNGSQIDYIGQQGPGGTPFPHITNIYTTSKNELVVVSSNSNGFLVFWFGENGFLKYKIPISARDVPKVSGIDDDSDAFLSLEAVVPDYNEYKLFAKIDCYSSYSDKASKAHVGVKFINSFLYTLDIGTGLYSTPITIPPYEESVTVDYSKLTYKYPYDFLGITKSGWMFFAVGTATGFDVEMIAPDGQKALHRHFKINKNNVLYHNMNLSSDGIISVLYVEPEKARVVWYRTDGLITDN